MRLLAFGINHKTAPVEIRERVAFPPERIPEALSDLVSQPAVNEAAILSTCNRTELYCSGELEDASPIRRWFADYHRLDEREIEPYVYVHPDQAAVRHLLRVASGLDSMVLGEPQILGQVKEAYRRACEAGTLGAILDRLYQHTFGVAKQVRTDTAIGASPVSVAFAAVSLARQFFSDFGDHTALLVGAGETIELTARHLQEQGIGRMIIANRTIERAHALAEEFKAYAIALDEIGDHLSEADLVIASTASPLPILGKGMVERALKARKRRPILMVDIAVPRDIEPEVGELADVYLYTVDDLQEIIQEGLKSRQEAAKKAEEIIDVQTLRFMGWLRAQAANTLIRMVREQAHQTAERELEKALRQLRAGQNPEEVVRRLAHGLTNKFLHIPSTQIRRAGSEGRVDFLMSAAELFDLKDVDLE